MQNFKSLYLFVSVLCLSLLFSACSSEEDPCELALCVNGASCNTGLCDCAPGFEGVHCESLINASVQELLILGVSPKAIVDHGFPWDSLYGKVYLNGLIFKYYSDGSGLVCAQWDQKINASWGCDNQDLPSLENNRDDVGTGKSNSRALLKDCKELNIAVRFCRDFGTAWFLPSVDELKLMYQRLKRKDRGDFASDTYWSSGESDDYFARGVNFENGNTFIGNKNGGRHVRAIRAFK